jgi:hypothetical protein
MNFTLLDYCFSCSDKAKFKKLAETMEKLSDEDLQSLQSIESPEPTTLAIVKSVLAIAGEDSEGSWDAIKSKLDRSLVEKLSFIADMDPVSRFTWNLICKKLKALFELEAEKGSKTDPDVPTEKEGAGQALGRWAVAVRALVARRALTDQLVEKQAKANKALMKAFAGSRGTGALNELKSYRVCPKITAAVLQCLLQLMGHSAEECEGWGRMRALASFKMIKSLAEVKPQEVPPSVLVLCIKTVKSVEEHAVKQESHATYALFKWLEGFAQLGSLVSRGPF